MNVSDAGSSRGGKLGGVELTHDNATRPDDTGASAAAPPAPSFDSLGEADVLAGLAEAIAAISEPPADTRAYFRGRCIDTFPEQVVAANWDSLVFDVGSDALRRVPMMEPMRGTRAHVGTLFDECESAAELLRRLGT